jgi:pyruvate/2-oxoglutarate dehydrogenase complex dihydrolipoamide acyltransferase (E2) component
VIVKFLNAHQYRGLRTDHPVHPARPRHNYQVGDLADIPADYYERHLAPYPFAQVYNAVAAAEGAAAALMEDMPIEQLRELIEKHGLDDKIEGSGPDGRALREDLVVVLDAHYKSTGRTKADEADIPEDDALARLRVDDLVALCETHKVEVDGTGHGGKVLKADMIEALSERRESDTTGKNDEPIDPLAD